jgi:hypothetical protein
MKMRISIFLVVFVSSFLSPLSTNAISTGAINATVQIVCPDDYGNWFSGSGTIIDSKGIILTNKHVVTDLYGGIIPTCFIGFIESISTEPNFGTTGNYNLAEVKYYTTTDDMDAAILYLNNPASKTFPYVNIWDSNSASLTFGNKLEMIGFPSIGGSTITYTSGDFSGFGSVSDGTQNYIKSTAILEHGNSGGGAYNSAGQFIGIPTMVISGTLNSISYILSVNSIKNWLAGFLGSGYKEEVIEQQPIIAAPQVAIQNDITPPSITNSTVGIYGYNANNEFLHYSEAGNNTAIYEFGRISFGWFQNCEKNQYGVYIGTCINDEESDVVGYYYYFGQNPTAMPEKDGTYIAADNMSKDTIYSHDPTYKDQVKLPIIFEAKMGKNYFILQAKDSNGNISNPLINLEYIYESDNFKDVKFFTIKNYKQETLGVLNYPARETWDYESHVIETNQSSLILCPDYGFTIDGLVYYISYQTDRWWFDKARTGTVSTNQCVTITNLNGKGVTNLFIKPNTYAINSFFGKHLVLTISYKSTISSTIQPVSKILSTNYENNTVYWSDSQNTMTFQKASTVDTSTSSNLNFMERVKGRILLQVEENGEAWYVRPSDSKRYYMKNGDVAYTMMRYFSLGITNADLAKIPSVSDTTAMKNSTSICTQNALANRLKGQILLQVEEHGEAWYIDPDKCRMIYMKDGATAYEMMRFLGLGITNADLNKIPVGTL